MVRTLYHGSKDIIKTPKFGFGRQNNDYGLGFYCTEREELAKEWAVAKDHDGWANRYKINEKNLTILNLNDPQYCILHWLAVLLENRQFETEYGLPSEAKAYLTKHFSVPYRSADVVVGYRAEDSYYSFAQDFISGAISYTQLTAAMRLGKLGNQYVLKSKAAFAALSHGSATPAMRTDWLSRKENRDRLARAEYLNELRKKRIPGDLRIDRIIDEEITPDDKRLR